MPIKAKDKRDEKENLHPSNLHRGRYDLQALCKDSPELAAFVVVNQYGNESLNFSNPQAVIALNKALLKHFYGVNYWEIPQGYLCPPIPGRADYIHYIADLLAENNNGIIPQGNKVKVLDIGTGANLVYPLIGNSVYQWQFVGADVDVKSIKAAQKIISQNKLDNAIELRQQPAATDIFKGIIKPDEFFDLTICNPPFHSSLKEAQAGTVKKWDNLGVAKAKKTTSNFGGQNNELWFPGGEAAFISRMIYQSTLFAKNCFWFTTLVSKKDTLDGIYKALKKDGVYDVKTISMSQGQKISRVVAWTFLEEGEQSNWARHRT